LVVVGAAQWFRGELVYAVVVVVVVVVVEVVVVGAVQRIRGEFGN
jgi:heme/copper-type cytochrome/quinol oxidase subunit 2